jgi:uncharacterized protein (TIGR00299 family) protein
MKVAYFDCFAGASGDMIVGALLDLGISLDALENELLKLGIGDFELAAECVTRSHIGATKFNVTADKQKVIRTWPSIRKLIEQSALSDTVKRHSLAIFGRIAEAEAKIHHKPVDQVHFHEVGAVDSIVDIVSSAIALELLKIERVYSSPIATGTGMVKTEHGMLPIPAPATAELLAGVPIYSSKIAFELTTPTGAAILTNYAIFAEGLPQITLSAIGYGAGERELEIPNVLRVMLGEEKVDEETAGGSDFVVLIETNLDNTSPEILGYTMEKLLELGAFDVWFTPIQMKKNRPAIMLSVLAPIGVEDILLDTIFMETSTLGVRITRQARKTAKRELITVTTPLGNIRVKR